MGSSVEVLKNIRVFRKAYSEEVLRNRIRWIRNILVSWIRIRKYAEPRIQGTKYQPKTVKRNFCSQILNVKKEKLLKIF